MEILINTLSYGELLEVAGLEEIEITDEMLADALALMSDEDFQDEAE